MENNYTENNIVTVKGHIRDLPVNYTASDQQRNLARENNVDLRANQTFVRKHEKIKQRKR